MTIPLEGTMRFAGFDVAIETRKGQVRTGVSSGGRQWAVRMPAHYGYIVGTKGTDGQGVDVFLGPNPRAQWVYVVHQTKNGKRGTYDEDKCMVGFNSLAEAEKVYELAYGLPGMIGAVSKIPLPVFHSRVKKLKGKKLTASFSPGVSTGVYDDDYFQFREKTAMQPSILPAHPPSLKNPQRVPADNPDEEGLFDKLNRKYMKKSARKQKATTEKREIRRAASKPEIAETTSFIPLATGSSRRRK